jgi:hypothetical protein
MRRRTVQWRPDWPAWLWLAPVATGIAAPVVARRTNGGACTTTINPGAWALASLTVGLAAFLAFAFSRQRGGERVGVALIVGVIVGAVVFGLTAFFAGAHSACD